jgi:hypothetical protein
VICGVTVSTGSEGWLTQDSPIEPIRLKFLRTVCGLGGVIPTLTCANALIHTLKRNSTTSPSAIT